MAEYIEREAALHVLGTMPLDWEMGEGRGVSDCYDAIKAIPAADVAPVRHGRWLLGPTNPYDDPGHKNRMVKVCSCCHWSNACRYNYCPNCGAKMDEKETEE